MRRHSAAYVLWAALTAGAVLAGGGSAGTNAARVDEPPSAGNPPPDKPTASKACRRPPGGTPASATGINVVRGDNVREDRPLCGTPGKDRIIGVWGNVVYAQPGNDVIDVDNNRPDDVWGGPGRDRAIVDRFDRVHGDVESSRRLSGATAPGSSDLPRQNGVVYPWYQATLECQLDARGRRIIRFAEEPTVRAVDASARVDWQTVAWSSLLYHWSGNDWVPVLQHIWLYDRTRDEQFDQEFGFAGNFWRGFDTNRRMFVWFLMEEGDVGAFRVALRLYWYEEASLAAHEELVWAGNHFGQFEDPEHTHQYCYFPA